MGSPRVFNDSPPISPVGTRMRPADKCGLLPPLPPVADRERKLVLEAFLLMLNSEYPAASVPP